MDRFENLDAFGYELLDVEGLDDDTLQSLQQVQCKAELVFQWTARNPIRSDISPISCLEPLGFNSIPRPMAFSYKDY